MNSALHSYVQEEGASNNFFSKILKVSLLNDISTLHHTLFLNHWCMHICDFTMASDSRREAATYLSLQGTLSTGPG